MDKKKMWERNYRQYLKSQSTKSVKSRNRFFDGTLGFPVIQAGEVNITTGQIEIGDPICYLGTETTLTPARRIPVGKYPVLLAVWEHSMLGCRYVAAKMDITGAVPCRYEPVVPEGCTVTDKMPEFMFPVETGMAGIADKAAAVAYREFLIQWHKEHPDGNHYDDLLAGYLRRYAKQHPDYQNPEGDYMEWYLPGTEHNLVMFASGYGDGEYSGYWGIDRNGEITCLILEFIDTEEEE